MLLEAVALTTAFATIALSAVLPAPHHDARSLKKRDYVTFGEVYRFNYTESPDQLESAAKEFDDAWSKVELVFPMTIYDKSSTTIWISMNGLICLDNPTGLGPSIPPRNFPIVPNQCNGGGCIPDHCIAVFWDDLYIPYAGQLLAVRYVYHVPNDTAPAYGPHYHVSWDVCSKSHIDPSIDPYKGCPKDAGRSFVVNIIENQPGRFPISFIGMPDGIEGIVGAQSYSGQASPKFVQTTKPPNWPKQQLEGRKACLRLDTKANVAEIVSPGEKCQ
ncbi:hypothetical protein ABW21_db0201116 [Orbilia brochopaga]|nr:hypothetical protein ABW21_db0201116 [Drechslerella brochopaga]